MKVDYHGQGLTVPVVDRGPYANGADWDLTAAAAQSLGIEETVRIATPSGRVPSRTRRRSASPRLPEAALTGGAVAAGIYDESRSTRDVGLNRLPRTYARRTGGSDGRYAVPGREPQITAATRDCRIVPTRATGGTCRVQSDVGVRGQLGAHRPSSGHTATPTATSSGVPRWLAEDRTPRTIRSRSARARPIGLRRQQP